MGISLGSVEHGEIRELSLLLQTERRSLQFLPQITRNFFFKHFWPLTRSIFVYLKIITFDEYLSYFWFWVKKNCLKYFFSCLRIMSFINSFKYFFYSSSDFIEKNINRKAKKNSKRFLSSFALRFLGLLLRINDCLTTFLDVLWLFKSFRG